MVKDHDIELHLAYWQNAIDGKLKSGSDPKEATSESADGIRELLKETAEKARAEIDRATELSIAFLENGGAERPSKEDVLKAIQSVRAAIKPEDIEKQSSALRPPLPTRRPS